METQNPENSVSFVNDAKHMDCRGEKLDFDYGAQGKPAFVRYGGSKYAYVYNLQGDVVALLASNGETVVQYEYDAWGKPVTMTGELADALGRLNPFRYRGYVFDEETGLYYLRSRYYDPVWGRFLNCDTMLITALHTLNTSAFAYCTGNPVNKVDPSGKIPLFLKLYALAYFVGDDSKHNLTGTAIGDAFTLKMRSANLVRERIKQYIKLIPEGGTSYSNTESVEWSPAETFRAGAWSDFDLAMTVGEATDCTVTVEKVEMTDADSFFYPAQKYKVTYRLRDYYDFDEETDEEEHWAVKWINNRLGYAPQEAGLLHKYWYTVSGEFFVYAY